jgi:hypothetical protein
MVGLKRAQNVGARRIDEGKENEDADAEVLGLIARSVTPASIYP